MLVESTFLFFYKGTYNGEVLPVQDNDDIVKVFSQIWESNNYFDVAKKALSIETYWGEDLTKVKKLAKAVALALEEIEVNGIEAGFVNYSNKF